MDTNLFDIDAISGSAGWIKELENEENEAAEEEEHHHHDHDDDDEDEEHEHEHGHHHHHHHDEGEAEEYGIATFVYTSRKAFDSKKFEEYVNNKFPKSVIRCKGLVWFHQDNDMSYLFEQAGKQLKLTESGYWLATAPKNELDQMIAEDPNILKGWDEEVGDRIIKLVFIGKDMDKEQIISDLDKLAY